MCTLLPDPQKTVNVGTSRISNAELAVRIQTQTQVGVDCEAAIVIPGLLSFVETMDQKAEDERIPFLILSPFSCHDCALLGHKRK